MPLLQVEIHVQVKAFLAENLPALVPDSITPGGTICDNFVWDCVLGICTLQESLYLCMHTQVQRETIFAGDI